MIKQIFTEYYIQDTVLGILNSSENNMKSLTLMNFKSNDKDNQDSKYRKYVVFKKIVSIMKIRKDE